MKVGDRPGPVRYCKALLDLGGAGTVYTFNIAAMPYFIIIGHLIVMPGVTITSIM